MRKIINYIMLICLLVSCKSYNRDDSDALFGEIFILPSSSKSCNLSEIFGENYRIIKLTTKDNEDIVVPRKIIKKKGGFYALSSDEIYLFDNFGEELSKLSKKGMANDEYLAIDDFDVFEGDKRINIVVCSQNKMLFYYLDMNEWKLEKILNYNNVIFDKIKVFENKIIAKIRGDKSLLISDFNGNVISKFYDLDINNIASKPTQFDIIDGKCIYQNGSTNSCVVIDNDLSHEEIDIVSSNDNILTTKITNSIYKSDRDNNGFTTSIKDYLNLATFKELKNRAYFVYMTDSFNKRYLVVKSGDISNSYCFYGNNATIKDDILGSDNLAYIASIITTESVNSIIFNVEATFIKGHTIMYTTSNGTKKYTVDNNDNNFLIEFMQ